MNSYKLLLLLSYFNTVQASYSYIEICELFGLNYQQIENFIDQLFSEEYIYLDGYYKISSKGKELLKQNQLDNIDIFDDIQEESIFVNPPLEFDEIYIPKNFTAKVK
ncbi:hypothetical protein ACFYKX_13175 [Cytobacillus sp. FJAT-54145]|uniref:Uncharacterized protein n=1 Tax=Cytobacillus spartinae TaxID=3299023 RepID=A0ABW6KF82_9BACI